jgi:magnesium transporter
MLFFSQLQENKVVDASGRTAGKLHDIAVQLTGSFPQSQSLIISRFRRGRRETVCVPWEWVASINLQEVLINHPLEEIWQSRCEPGGLLLGRNLLDRQIVDLHGNKVVRANDLRLGEFDSKLRLMGVDVSPRALLRRLGLEKTAGGLLHLIGKDLADSTIPWNYVTPLEVEELDLRLTLTRSQLIDMHPTDIADILEQLDPEHRERVLDVLGSFAAAESLSEVERAKQADVIGDLSETKASNLLEIMPPDEAADILALLPRDKAERLLNIMGMKGAEIIRELLGYPEDTAGGRMTPEFLAVSSSFTAEECMNFLRREAPDAETLYYLYVMDNEGRLKGVLSLRDLLRSRADQKVEDFMHRDVISVSIYDDQELVADIMSRYNFLALPVVDEENFIKGIITVDDMIDVIREEAIEDLSHLAGIELTEAAAPSFVRRLLPIAITLIGGIAAALILSVFQNKIAQFIALIFFLPLVLRAGQSIGMFSQAVVLEEIGGKEPSWGETLALAWKELKVVFLLSVIIAAAGGLIAALWQRYAALGLTVGIALFATVLLGSLVGILLPIFSRRLKGELRYTQARFSSLFISLATLTIYLGLATLLLTATQV